MKRVFILTVLLVSVLTLGFAQGLAPPIGRIAPPPNSKTYTDRDDAIRAAEQMGGNTQATSELSGKYIHDENLGSRNRSITFTGNIFIMSTLTETFDRGRRVYRTTYWSGIFTVSGSNLTLNGIDGKTENWTIISTNTISNGYRQWDKEGYYADEILDPNPAPNSGDDFIIRQNAQGGITITEYISSRRQVVIPETISGIKVTEIAANAFGSDSKNIVSVVIPNTVTQIGAGAFANKNLKSVVLSNSLTTIHARAFYGCAIETVIIPNSVTTIGAEAFRKCQLTSITFGNRVAEIGDGAFAENKLTELTNLPTSLRVIGLGAFAENAITTLTIPNGVTMLWPYCFSNNPIKTLIIPSSLAEWRGQPSGTMYRADLDYTVGFGRAFQRVQEWRNAREWSASSPSAMNIGSGTAITLPANVADNNLLNNFGRTFVDFYISQNRKAGTYSFDGRLWSVK